ncbi:MAG: sigma-70 family RNA polymerase sigma factor [Nitrospirae bacterium]|nr:MAG: sigma-70 family RNA polymerase sigma factor [Nitrospirota bacterium]
MADQRCVSDKTSVEAPAMPEHEEEFDRVYKTFHPKILRYLSSLVGTYAAEDLAQEVFIKVGKAMKGFRGEASLSTWIYRIATNTALDHQRSSAVAQRARMALLNISTPEIEQELKDKKPSAEKSLIRKEMNQCIRRFIEDLPADYRTVIVLKELEELKNSEIAEILGVTLETVKIRLHRAKAKLKKEFETHCNFYRDEQNVLSCDLKSALKGLKGKS